MIFEILSDSINFAAFCIIRTFFFWVCVYECMLTLATDQINRQKKKHVKDYEKRNYEGSLKRRKKKSPEAGVALRPHEVGKSLSSSINVNARLIIDAKALMQRNSGALAHVASIRLRASILALGLFREIK